MTGWTRKANLRDLLIARATACTALFREHVSRRLDSDVIMARPGPFEPWFEKGA